MAMKVKCDKDTIIITIDTSAKAFAAAPLTNKGQGPNKSLATTGGNSQVFLPNGASVKLGVNCYFNPADLED